MKRPPNLSDNYLIGYKSKPVSRGPRGWVGNPFALLAVPWLKVGVPFCRNAQRRVVKQEEADGD